MFYQPELPFEFTAASPARNTTTFADNMKLPVHRWFRYSAGFSAAWVELVIRANNASRVLDPFSGSGTTAFSAERVGAETIGIDVHPFVSRVAQAKSQWRLNPETLIARGNELLELARSLPEVAEPDSPLVAKCFPDTESRQNLLKLRDAQKMLEKGDGYDNLLWLAIVSIIRACSPAGTAQWQYVLPNKTKIKVAEPYTAFTQRVELFAQDMAALSPFRNNPKATLLEDDARSLQQIEDGWADLIVTSPPYANNFDYADATRLEQTFLGEISGWADLKYLRNKLVKSATQHMGGWDSNEAFSSPMIQPIYDELQEVYSKLNDIRQTKGGNKAYHLMVAGYFYDSAQIWHSLRRVTKLGATVCYVIGDSAPYGIHVPVERWLGELALSAGFDSWEFEKVRDRNTKWKNRKHTHPLHEGRLWIRG